MNDVGRGMPSSPLGSTHARTTSGLACHHCLWTSRHSRTASGVACHHRPWMANTVERRRAWQAIITIGQNIWSDGDGRGMPSWRWTAHTVKRRQEWHAIIAFGKHTWSNIVGRGMPSKPLGSTHGRTTSGVACHHRPLTANTVERCRPWHAIIAFGQHR